MSEMKFTPGPWECIPSTEHHGAYVIAPYSGDIADCYAMSNPSSLSVRNGGNSEPIPFQGEQSDANARLIAAAPEMYKALQWYAEQARLCRLIHSGGDEGRKALSDDGGKRATEILNKTTS